MRFLGVLLVLLALGLEFLMAKMPMSDGQTMMFQGGLAIGLGGAIFLAGGEIVAALREVRQTLSDNGYSVAPAVSEE